jgi:hypothetical protein
MLLHISDQIRPDNYGDDVGNNPNKRINNVRCQKSNHHHGDDRVFSGIVYDKTRSLQKLHTKETTLNKDKIIGFRAYLFLMSR